MPVTSGIAAIAGATAAGIANATANIGFVGLDQSAVGPATSVNNVITNETGASLSMLASANASGATANANGHIQVGIFQQAAFGDVSADTLTNEGTIDTSAHAAANATAGAAHAFAGLTLGSDPTGTGAPSAGIVQFAGHTAIGSATTAIGTPRRWRDDARRRRRSGHRRNRRSERSARSRAESRRP